jgi:hypothetical protein
MSGGVVFYRLVREARRRRMGSLIGELKRREAAARAEADGLRSRMEQVARDLARAEEQVSRLVIAQEEVARVLEEPASGAVLADGQAREPREEAGRSGNGSPIGVLVVPRWRAGLEALCCRRLTGICWR